MLSLRIEWIIVKLLRICWSDCKTFIILLPFTFSIDWIMTEVSFRANKLALFIFWFPFSICWMRLFLTYFLLHNTAVLTLWWLDCTKIWLFSCQWDWVCRHLCKQIWEFFLQLVIWQLLHLHSSLEYLVDLLHFWSSFTSLTFDFLTLGFTLHLYNFNILQ